MAIGLRNRFSDLFQHVAGGGQARFSAQSGRRKSVGRLPTIVEIVLVALLGILLGLIFLTLFAPLSVPDRTAVAAVSGPQNSNQIINAKSPFPASAIAPTALEEAPAVAETTLNLKLTGVWANEDGGSATIKLADGREKRFAVGDEIVSGVTLSAVYADQVTLLRGGAREALKFESKTLGGGERTVAPPPNRIVRAPSVTRLSSFMRLAPVRNIDGEFSIEVYPVRDRAAFNALGLQAGDRLVSINGATAPRDAAALGRLIQEIQQSDRASVVVDRDGSQIPITITLDQLEGSDVE